ncbi:TonB-dependent receptor [Novosphingobium flavum]|uniref:TonB-dependent receptor n=1 Tax=Novosphingobium flavum TaxID=1778672 RepID=A0A7X1FSH6_9SPHN|nr:TonB-dependent receptor [Novosphingobium flavum]MBC2666143.1 TonB-dependent receptor [Novosphingobium flavum]
MRNCANRLVLSASLASLAIVLAAPAFAQEAAAAAPAEEEAAPPAQEIVVTGSLIQRPNNTAVSPIVTVGEAAIKESGTATLQDALNQMPSFTAGGNAATGGQGSGGRASINLHGLGTNRNLVLLDGRRLPVSDINGNVDINILPDAIIGGIDAITGGASAIYGSDAMSGVVNFKTIRSFNGIKMDVMNSISEKGDAYKFNGSLALGTSFADDRGHVIAAFSYAKQDPVLSGSRDFFLDKVPSSFIGYGAFVPSATNTPDATVLTNLFNAYGVAGARNPLASNLGFNDDGTLFTQSGALNYKGYNGTNGYAVVGGNVRMPVGQQGNLLNALNRKTAFLKADYELAPSLTAYGQFMFVDLNVNTNSGGSLTQFTTLTTIPVTNPFIPNDLKTVLASRPNAAAPFAWSGRYVGVPWKNWDENYQVQQYMAGLKGEITSGWNFDVFASYDQSIHNQIMHNAVLKSRVQTLLNAADGGKSICAGGFNPFGNANALSLSPACQAYITKDTFSQERLSQTQVQGQVNGKLFDLGAGPAQIAVVADWRKNTYAFSPDSDMTALSGWAPGANVEAFTATIAVPEKSISVKELAGQIDVPLLADKPFFKELAIGAAARVSDYSVTGSVKSYEFDARWRPTDSLLFRGSYQRAVRAPNIGELYSPPSGSQLVIGTPPTSLGDPCDSRSTARIVNGVPTANAAQVAALCVAQGVPSGAISTYQFPTTATGQTIAGSTSVTPETADTFNVGFVFNSPATSGFLSDFSVSVDYYNIKIKNVISAVPGLTVLSKCYNLDGSNPTYAASNAYCGLISRDSTTGQILTVSTPYQNLGGVKTDGIEAQVHWGTRAGFIGQSAKVYIDSAIGWLHSYKVQLLPGAAFLDYTGISVGGTNPGSVPSRATPRWRALTTFGVKSDVVGFGLRWRYQSAMKDVSSVLTPTNAQVGVPAYALWDLFGSVKVSKAFELRGGVTNLFNKSLPFVASSQNGTDTAQYDAIGRSFYIGAKLNF